jgi:peptidoglycan L-alanyl-D-glutamate endopeptidase CwlK
MFKLGSTSSKTLGTCVHQLQDVVRRALELSDVDFSVIEGIRSIDTQRQYVAEGLSWTMDSKHLTGRAVDLYPWVDGETSHEPAHYNRVAKAMFAAAQELGVTIEWGGFWYTHVNDKPHWALD